MKPKFQTICTLKFIQSRNLVGNIIKTNAMTIFLENTEGQSKFQVMIDYIIDSSLNFVVTIDTYTRSITPDLPGVFNERTNSRFLNEWINFSSSRSWSRLWFNISRKTWVHEGACVALTKVCISIKMASRKASLR